MRVFTPDSTPGSTLPRAGAKTRDHYTISLSTTETLRSQQIVHLYTKISSGKRQRLKSKDEILPKWLLKYQLRLNLKPECSTAGSKGRSILNFLRCLHAAFKRIYPKEPKTLIRKNISTPMFIAALFTITKIWKQSKCPTIDEWIKQLWEIYTMEFYLAIKKKILPFETVWKDLESIVQSE